MLTSLIYSLRKTRCDYVRRYQISSARCPPLPPRRSRGGGERASDVSGALLACSTMGTQALRQRQMLMERLRADQSQLTAQKRQRLSSEPSPSAPSQPQPPFTRTDAAKQRSVLRARWSADRLAEDVACDRRQAIVLRHARESSVREAERLQRQAASAVQRAELAKAKAEAAETAQTAEEEATQAARANRAVRVEVAAEDAAVDPAEEMAGEEAVEEAEAAGAGEMAGAQVGEVEKAEAAAEAAHLVGWTRGRARTVRGRRHPRASTLSRKLVRQRSWLS